MTEHITSRKNQLMQHVLELGGKASARARAGEYLCDGPKLLEDALGCGVTPTVVISALAVALPPLPPQTRQVTVPPALLDSLSPMDTPQGVLFICPQPGPLACLDPQGRYTYLDGVQDPRNVGAIMRSAEAFGLNGVLLSPGCADAFGPKAVRAAMGATFRLPVGQLPLEALCASGLPLIAAALGGEDIRLASWGPCILAVGSEGSGLSEKTLSQAARRVHIPMPGGAQSLNAAVAAAILFWEVQRSFTCREDEMR